MPSWISNLLKLLPQSIFGSFVVGKDNKILIVTESGKIISKKHIFIKGLNIRFEGKKNTITIYEPCSFENSKIFFCGENCECVLKKCRLINAEINLNEGGNFSVDENSSVNGLFMLVNEKNTSISIGKDCMFSANIDFWPTDGHCIVDSQDICINKASKGIVIGNHVWIGRGVSVMKKVSIADNCIIGCASVVTHSFDTPGSIIAGNPAKVVKSNMNWKRTPPV